MTSEPRIWNSRKFLTMVSLEIVTTLLLWFGKIGPSEWQSVTVMLAGFYFAANVSAIAVNGRKPPSVDVDK